VIDSPSTTSVWVSCWLCVTLLDDPPVDRWVASADASKLVGLWPVWFCISPAFRRRLVRRARGRWLAG
jgi:hypothetical protein